MKREKLISGIGAAVFIKAAILGVAVTLLAMLLEAALMLLLQLDIAYAPPFATLSLALGCFVAAFYSAKRVKSKGYLIGLIIGLAVFGIIAVISLITDSGSLTLNTLFHLVIITLSSFIGGVLGVGGNKKYI